MNIQEAIKSNKPFRRIGMEGYHHWKKFNIWYVISEGMKTQLFGYCRQTKEDAHLGQHHAWDVNDILADNWEIKK